MAEARRSDRIDLLISALRNIPDLGIDPQPMGILIRLARIAEVVDKILEGVIQGELVRHKKDHDLLVALLQSRRPLRNKDLEPLLNLKTPSVSQRVNRLVEAGLVLRVPVEHDSRANQLTLTDLGRSTTIKNIERAVSTQQALLHSALTAEQIAVLETLLRDLNLSLGDAPTRHAG